MIVENDIRSNVSAYLRNELQVDDLEDWVVANRRDMHFDSTDEAVALATVVDLALIKYSASDITESELRSKLANAVGYVAGTYDPIVGHRW